MAKIVSVQARSVRIPLAAATGMVGRNVVAREYGLVKIRTDDGVEGIGYCYAGAYGAKLVTLVIREFIAPLLLSANSTSTEFLWQKMYRELMLLGRAGVVMRALSMVDIALWDRNARAARLPLYRYLGAAFEDTVPAYASGGYYHHGKTPEHLGEEMAGYVAAGFTAVKMKTGRDDLKTEVARVAAARKAIGPDIPLMLDANNAWSDVPTALRFMKAFAPYDPYFIEEPFSPEQIDNHAKLAAAISIPVATGEIEAGRWRVKELLDKKAAAILQPDSAVCGGITEFRRIAALADSYGVNIAPHWFHDLSIHLLASLPNGEFVEYFPNTKVLNFGEIIDRQLEFKKGRLVLPTEPGLGFNFDEKAIGRLDAEPWS